MPNTDVSPSLQHAIDSCAQEPIRTPGSVQPQGFLLAIEEPTMHVLQVSENLPEWLGVDIEEILGQRFGSLVEHGETLVDRLEELEEDESHPYHVADVRFLVGRHCDLPIAMMLHRYDHVLIAEFSRPNSLVVTHSRLYPMVRSFISRSSDIETVDQVCDRAARLIKRLTGFGRVKSYRFDEAGNGLVNAEVLDEGYRSYQGLCFPASDIPAQARALYCTNRIRVIEDANYVPAKLVPALNPITDQALDLSYATLRSVSPVHLQYMRNMETLASMSISIVVDGRLWGLISCHHDSAHPVSFETRTSCELLGRVLSLQIETREAHTESLKMLDIRRRIVNLLAAIADHDSVLLGLRAVPDTFIDFANASGAAVVSGVGCDIYGRTPSKLQVQALAEWLATREDPEFFQTDNAGRDIPDLPAIATAASGVLAVSISELHSHYLIWFKPEQAQVVKWAGKPDKTISDTGSLNPRQSFDQWQQVVEGFSTPWRSAEAVGVQELRLAVLGIVLRKAEELAQLSEDLEKTNKELEAFSYSVSHDLRAPLRHIAGYAELLADMESPTMTERGQRFLETIENAAKFAGTLVDNLLSFSQMGRSAMHVTHVNLTALIESIRSELKPDFEGREIQWSYANLPMVVADPAFLHLAMRNLISNALKYSKNRAVATINIGSEERLDDIVISVRDNGVGFDMKYVGKLFGVFQRLHRIEEFEGTGIGLANVRRIIERHDGSVWAKGALDEGATFFFSLPKKSLHPVAAAAKDLPC